MTLISKAISKTFLVPHFPISTAICLCLLSAASIARADATVYRPNSAGVSAMYYQSNDDNVSTGFNADLVLPSAGFDIAASALGRYTEDPQGEANMEAFLLGTNHKLSDAFELGWGAGGTLFNDSEQAIFIGTAKWHQDWFTAQFQAERTPLYQTARIIRNELLYYGFESKFRFHVAERFEPKLEANLRSYSDNNASYKVRADLPLAIVFEPVKLTLGYRQERTEFRRQSGGGYFDPSSLDSYQGVATLSGTIDYFSFYAEVFGGRQYINRYANNAADTFTGAYVYARFDNVGPFAIIFDGEASDYSLSSVSGFKYTQGALRIETSW